MFNINKNIIIKYINKNTNFNINYKRKDRLD